MFLLKWKEETIAVYVTEAGSLTFAPKPSDFQEISFFWLGQTALQGPDFPGVLKALVSLSPGSASSWDSSSTGMLTAGLSPKLSLLTAYCCCFWYCRSPVSCKVLGKDK